MNAGPRASRIVVIAALPGELKALVKGWRHEGARGAEVWTQSEGRCVAACAGMGGPAAIRALEAAEEGGRAEVLISAGWAGSLDPSFAPGMAYQVSEVLDLESGLRYPMAGSAPACLLVSGGRVADAADKRRLAAAHGPGLVDMEAAALARLARQRGSPMLAFKGVSDAMGDSLPDFNPFLRGGGRFDLSGFVLYSLLRPALWPSLLRLGVQGGRSARALARGIEETVQGL